MNTINVGIIKHFAIDDKQCSGDYHYIDCYINGVKVATYGDEYHDKGDDKIHGFLDGFKYATGGDFKFNIVRSNQNDSED